MGRIAYELGKVNFVSVNYMISNDGFERVMTVDKAASGAVGRSDVKRGTISGFSRDSVRRLRHFLHVSALNSEHVVCGLTYTLPWLPQYRKGDMSGRDEFIKLMPEFQEGENRFWVAFRRKFPQSAAARRVELQERGSYHLHAVHYHARSEIPELIQSHPDAIRLWLQLELGRMWREAFPNLHGGDYFEWEKYGVKANELHRDGDSLFRYLCDHTSKKKQAQLGYPGKQWGIIGRKNIIERKDMAQHVQFASDAHYSWFWRLMRRVTAYHPKTSGGLWPSKVRLNYRHSGVVFTPAAARAFACAFRIAHPGGKSGYALPDICTPHMEALNV